MAGARELCRPKGHLGATSPGTSSLPQAQGQSYLLLLLERILPLGPSCRLLGLSPTPSPSAPSLSNSLGFIY